MLCVTALTLDTTKIFFLRRTTNSRFISSGDDAVRMRCLILQLFLYCPIFAFVGYIESLSNILNPILLRRFRYRQRNMRVSVLEEMNSTISKHFHTEVRAKCQFGSVLDYLWRRTELYFQTSNSWNVEGAKGYHLCIHLGNKNSLFKTMLWKMVFQFIPHGIQHFPCGSL